MRRRREKETEKGKKREDRCFDETKKIKEGRKGGKT